MHKGRRIIAALEASGKITTHQDDMEHTVNRIPSGPYMGSDCENSLQRLNVALAVSWLYSVNLKYTLIACQVFQRCGIRIGSYSGFV